ncbi:MAG: hypothetical protein ACO1N7_08920 [Sphingobacteriaceae bacterium]
MNKLYLFVFILFLAFGCKKNELEEEFPKQEYVDSIISISGTDTVKTAFEYTDKNQLSKIVKDKNHWVKLEYYPSGELAIVNAYSLDASRKKIREYLVLNYNKADSLKSGTMTIYKDNLKISEFDIIYKLNNLGQVIEILSGDQEKMPNQTISYDDKGNIRNIGLSNSSKSFTYNDKKNFLHNVPVKYYIGLSCVPLDLFNKNDITNANNGYEEKAFTTEYNSENVPMSSEVIVTEGTASVTHSLKYKYILK